jgi:hypothetical protein
VNEKLSNTTSCVKLASLSQLALNQLHVNLSTDNDVTSVAADVGSRVAARVVVALLLVLVLVLLGSGSLVLRLSSRSGTTLNSLDNITSLSVSGTTDGTTGDDIRAGGEIVGGGRAPEGEVDGRVVLLVDTGDLDGGAGNAGGAVAGDLKLSAGSVELSLTTVSTVESNVLTTDDVLTVRESGGDLEVDGVLVPRAPRGTTELLGAARLADETLVDLVPVEVGRVSGGGVVDLGGVDLDRTRVLHTGTAESLLKTNLVTGLDLEDIRRSGGALVADKVLVVGGDGARGSVLELHGHVSVLVLTDVLVVGTLLLTADGELVEGVVGADGGGKAENSGEVSGGLHFERVVWFAGEKSE